MGYHYEGIENTIGKIVPETKTEPNRLGVYEGKVMVNGILKRRTSTFFPREWSPWQVAYAILEAYKVRSKASKKVNLYEGALKSGLKIRMFMRNGKIVSAYPIKE